MFITHRPLRPFDDTVQGYAALSLASSKPTVPVTRPSLPPGDLRAKSRLRTPAPPTRLPPPIPMFAQKAAASPSPHLPVSMPQGVYATEPMPQSSYLASRVSALPPRIAPTALQKLRQALYYGDVELIRFALRGLSPAALNQPIDTYGTTLLIEAAASSKSPEVALVALLDAGVDVDGRNHEGSTALLELLMRESLDEASAYLLVMHGAQPSIANGHAENPLSALLMRWPTQLRGLLPLFISHGANLSLPGPGGVHPLFAASSGPEASYAVRKLLAACPEEERVAFVTARSYSKDHIDLGCAATAALHHNADDFETERVLALLIAAGQNAAILSHDALSIRLAYETPARAVQDFIARIEGARGMTPPGSASASIHSKSSADSTERSKGERLRGIDETSLASFARRGSVLQLEEKIRREPQELMRRDHLARGGNLPLGIAIQAGRLEQASFLLQAMQARGLTAEGALEHRNVDGKTALFLCIEQGSEQLLAEMLDAGADAFAEAPCLRLPHIAHGVRQLFGAKRTQQVTDHALQCEKPELLESLLLWDEQLADERRGKWQFSVEVLHEKLAKQKPRKSNARFAAVLAEARNRRV